MDSKDGTLCPRWEDPVQRNIIPGQDMQRAGHVDIIFVGEEEETAHSSYLEEDFSNDELIGASGRLAQ